MILKRFFLITWLLFFLSSAIADEAVYSPGTGLLVGNLKTNQYFILDDKQLPPTKVVPLANLTTTHQSGVFKLRLALHKMKNRFIPPRKMLIPRAVIRQAIQHKPKRHHLHLVSRNVKHLTLHKKTKLVMRKHSKYKHSFAMKNYHRHLAFRRLIKNKGKG